MKNNYLVLFIILFGSFLSESLYAQHNISGIVTDKKNDPLIGVSVTEVAANTGTVTYENGQYRLSVSPNAKIRFSYLGYKSVEIPVDSRTVYNIQMAPVISFFRCVP